MYNEARSIYSPIEREAMAKTLLGYQEDTLQYFKDQIFYEVWNKLILLDTEAIQKILYNNPVFLYHTYRVFVEKLFGIRSY